jgi:hypothetical protein
MHSRFWGEIYVDTSGVGLLIMNSISISIIIIIIICIILISFIILLPPCYRTGTYAHELSFSRDAQLDDL